MTEKTIKTKIKSMLGKKGYKLYKKFVDYGIRVIPETSEKRPVGSWKYQETDDRGEKIIKSQEDLNENFLSSYFANIGIFTGRQDNGKYIIVLDYDIYDKNTCKSCEKTIKWANEVDKIIDCDDGYFTSSTCTNKSRIVDISKYEELMTLFDSLPTTVKSEGGLEILNRFNCIVPPCTTECKKHHKACNARKFMNKKIVYECCDELAEYLTKFVQNNCKKKAKVKAKTKIKNSNKKTQKVIVKVKDGKLIFEDDIHLSIKQYDLINKILDEISKAYNKKTKKWIKTYENRDTWMAVCWAMRDLSNTPDMFNLFDEWSKQSNKKYSRDACIEYWNQQDSNRESKYTFGTVIFWYKNTLKKKLKDEISKLDKKKDKDKITKLREKFNERISQCSRLNIGKHIDQLEGIDDVKNIEIRKFNSQFITKLDKNKKGGKWNIQKMKKEYSDDFYKPNLFKIKNFKSQFKNKVLIIKSHTGSGKTAMLKSLRKLFSGHFIISLSYRRTLGSFLSNVLNLTYYADSKVDLKKPESWFQISVQLESLVKAILFRKNKYVLFMDETNGLLCHLMNRMKNMPKIRRKILNIMSYLILKAEYVICTDADITTPTIEFIRNICNMYDEFELSDEHFYDFNENNDNDNDNESDSNDSNSDSDSDDSDDTDGMFDIKKEREKFIEKDIVFYQNQYVGELCDVTEYQNQNNFVKKLTKDLMNNVNVYVCSDKNSKFYKDIFSKIVEYLKMSIKGIKKKDMTDTQKELKRRLDNDYFKFYSSNKGDTDDFYEPKKLIGKNIFASPTLTTGVDLNNKDIKYKTYGFYFGTHLDSNLIVQQINRIRNPKNINLYFSHDCYTPEYANFDVAKQKSNEAIQQVNKLLNIKNTNRTIDKIYTEFSQKTTFVQEKLRLVRYHVLSIMKHKGHKIKYNEKYVRKSLLNKIKINMKDIEEKELQEQIEKLIPYIYDSKSFTDKQADKAIKIASCIKLFRSFAVIRKILGNNIEDMQIRANKYDDLPIHNVKNDDTKITIIKRLMETLNINSLEKVNYIDNYKKLIKSKKMIKLPILYVKTFRLRSKAYKEKEITHIQAHKLLLEMLMNVAPSYVTEKNKKKINGKQIYYKKFNYKTAKGDQDVFSDKERFTENVFKPQNE